MTDIWPQLVESLRLDLLGILVLSAFLGGAVGLEREIHGKDAGLRTNILICVGATLFTQLSVRMTGVLGDPSRIAAQIVTGVGFIGAGTILHARGSVTGLTSAATIWVVAAIGMALGAGALLEGVGATLLLLLVLAGLGRIETYVKGRAAVSELSVEMDRDDGATAVVEELVRAGGLEVEEMRTEVAGENRMRVHVTMRGPKPLHDKARLAVLRGTGTYRRSTDE